MNKIFTGTTVLQLAEAGKVEVTEPLGEYLTDYRDRDVAATVTIHHLLTHAGGRGDIFGPQLRAQRLQLCALDDYVELYGDREPEFEPGSRRQYSNYGYIPLGALIEKVTGQTYYDYVHAPIYQTAQMTATGSQPEDHIVPDLSVGHMRRPGTQERPHRGRACEH